MITKSNKHPCEINSMKNNFLPTNIRTSCLKIRNESAGHSFHNSNWGTLDLPVQLHTFRVDRFLFLKYLYILSHCILFFQMSRSPTMSHLVRTLEESSKVRSKVYNAAEVNQIGSWFLEPVFIKVWF